MIETTELFFVVLVSGFTGAGMVLAWDAWQARRRERKVRDWCRNN